MKKHLLLILLMILSLSFMSSLFAQVSVTIGEGTSVNTTTGVPAPYGTYYKAFRQQFLVLTTELNNGGGGPGEISSVAFNVDVLNNCTPMPNYRIRMKHTAQTALTSTFEDGAYQTVFQADEFMPTTGWNTHQFSVPFVWDGASNILIETVTDVIAGSYAQNASTFYTTTSFNSSLRYQNDSNNGETGTTGTTSTNRANMKFMMEELDMVDMVAMSIAGPSTPSVNDNAIYTIRVKSLCPTTVSDYTVKLMMAPDIVLETQAGISIDPMGELDFEFTWTPTEGGNFELYGRVEKTGDENPANDNTTMYPVLVLPEGTVIIGDGTLTQRFPFGHLFGFERSASVYPFDEIGAVGVVERIGWNCTAVGTMPVPYKIYLGTINETEMTQQPYNTMIEDMTLVSEGELTFTSLGWILFDLDTPFVYTGGNLVVAVEVNYGGGGGQATERFTYTGGHTNKHIYWTADNNPPTTNGTRTALRPNLMMQLGELTGDPELAVSPVSINFGDAIFGTTIGPRNISLSNIGGGSLTVNASDVSLTGSTQFSYDNSVFPLVLGSGETLQIPVTLVGTIEGPAEAAITITYGTQTFVVELSANVLPDGLVIIGNGTANNYMPVNTYYGYSYAQMLYRADEIMTADRQIEKVAYHWNGAGAAPNTSDWTIYMGHTDKEAFASTTDWIALDDLVQVYQGTVEMTAVNQWIEIELNLPFIYDGVDNLVIAVRETFPGYDSSSYFFYNTPSTTGRSIRCQNDSTVPDPAAPPTGTLTAAYPNIRMFFGDVPDNPVISVSPENINFGTIFFNAQSDVRNVTVFNAGGGTLQLGAAAVQITGENAALFSFDDSVFPFALETGESAQIPVSLVGSVEGNVVASLEITYAGEVSTVGLSANVLPDGVVIVGNGTLTQRQPFGGLYGYERSVGLYKADEIASVGSIYNIGWHLSTANVNIMPYKIYLGVTNDEVLTAQTFADISANMTLVKEGTHLFENLGWNNFELDTPYIYTGGNLLVAVESNYGGTGGFGTINFNYTSATALHMNWQTDNNPPAVNGTVNANRPNLMLMLGALDGDPELAVNPAAINFGDVVFGATLAPRNINLSNIGGGVLTVTATDVSFVGSDQFSYDTSILPATIGSAETIQIPVTMTGTVEGPAAATITITHAGEEFEVALSANVLPDGLVVIGDGTTNSYMPVNTFYGYSYAQMLYKADEIMTQDRQLEKVAYHWNGAGAAPNSDQWTIYIGHTDKEAFANTTDWIGVNDLTVVYQGTVTMPAENMWIEIELETPFIYNGVDNLVIAVRETQPSYDSSSYFFYNTASTTGRSIRYQSDSIIPDPAAPPTGTLMAAYPNIRMYFGDIPTEPVLAVSPNVDEWDFGLKPALSTTTKAFTIANNGSGVLTVNNVVVTGAGFALQETFESVGLASTESVVITVVYSPADVGDYEGLLAITTSHGNREIDLVGSCYNPIITEFPFFEGFEVGNTEGSTTIAQWEQIIGTEYATQSWTANSTLATYNRAPRTGDWNVTLRYNGESTLVRPIMLEAGETYSLEFWARQDAASGATIEAILGDNDQLIGDIIEIVPASPVYAGDYQQFTGEFEVAVSGLYYLGIYGYVTITPWYISLDDISIYQGEIPEDLVPPSYLRASVDGMEVQLAWNAPGDDIPPAGTPQWITWCDVNTYGQNAIGTGNAAVFDVAHRFDENDLASVQEMALTKMKFVPNQVDCVYTAKVWVGTSAAAPSTLVHSQVVTNPTIGAWNEVVFTTPIPIPAIGELWFGYEANTQTGHPAGVDAGPPVAGKGNMFYFNNQWMELTAAGATLTYNWSIQGFVDNVTPPASARVLKSIPEEPRGVVLGANFSALHNVISPSVSLNSRALTRDLNGYKVYRDDSLIATVTNPATLTYLDEVAAAGVYSYTVTAIYDGGESEPAGPVEVEVEAPAAPVFAITPTSHNFGQVNVGSTQSQQFTISNAGAGTLTINAITISGAMMSLGTLPTLPVNLTAGQTLEFNANYTPTAEGAHTGAITITDNLTRIAHTVALSGTGVDMGDLYPPTNLQASVSGMDVTLTWEPPVTGEWITWCIPEDIGNGIGTNSAATFDVAHRFDANDLAPYQGNAITRVSFVPNEANCVYTVKLWAGTSAAAPSTMIHSQVVSSPVIGAWNEVLLTSPVTIPATGELWVGFESNTQAGYPAGCDNGPAVNGKGNMINMGGWDTLIDVAPTLNYNWSIMAYVDYEARALVHADQPAIAEPVVSVNKTATTRNVAELSVNNDLTVASHEIPGVNRARTGYNLYRDNVLVGTVAENEDYIYVDSVTSFGTYAYTVTAVYDEGESAPEGPVVVTVADLEPPTDLGYSIAQNHVTLNWANPTPPLEGEWISWSNNDDLGNSIGTGGATSFEVAHRYAASDLTDHVGGRIAKVMIVPGYEFCTYTVKVWTGGNASSPGNLMATQVVENPQVGTWNSVILYNPVEILAGQELWIGYHVNTQGGHPAGCDNGPMVSGKGNMMNMGGWTTLDAVAASLTYNWQIQGLVVQTRDGKNVETPILVDNQSTGPMSTLSLAQVSPKKDRNVVLVGYRVYRDGEYIGSVNDPDITTFTQRSVPNGVYVYGVTGVYNTGESSPATIEVTVNLELEEAVFEDSFEEYADFATAFEPWTLRDQDGSESYGFTGIEFPGSGSAFAYMIFNPSQTVPPIVGLDPYEGAKMAASFAAVNGPNNDYLITPRIQLGTNSAIRFFARSHTAQYGLERFKAAVSIMPSPGIMSGYNYVSGDEDVLVPANWTEYYYDISNYDNQQVYIAVRCVSDDAFVFYVDNFSVHTDLTSNEDEFAPVAVTQLAGNYPNPFNPETTISYSMKEAGSVSIDIYNIKGQLVKHLVKGDMAAGNHTVVWNGTDNNNRAVSSGVYFYKMNSGNYSSTKKMIMMK